MTRLPPPRRPFVAALALLMALGALAVPAAGQTPPEPRAPDDLSVVDGDAPTPDGDVRTGTKAATSTAAETDPALLARDDGAPVNVVLKLDYDSIATYSGGRRGLPATSPTVTGEPLTAADVTTSPYARQVARDEAAIVAAVEAAVPSVEIGQSLRTVVGGVSAVIPADSVETLLEVPGVVAVLPDELRQLTTDSSPTFIGADQVWAQQGGAATAGSGVIFGSLDTGVWPEHPSLADTGALGAPPAKADGTPRTCSFGDDPLTPAADVFECNDKLIGGQPFLATYDAMVGGEVYPDSARDSNGHGTHTATTAAGNPVSTAAVVGIDRGPIAGVAPGAWVSAYKVCGAAGCYASDSAAAVAQAILDGVDVINFSISGGANPFADVAELAFLDAYAAGVFVAASAGNSGPGASTVDHRGPWTTTVAATHPGREYTTTLQLTGTAGATLSIPGASIGSAVPAAPVVLASAPPYGVADCDSPAPPGLLAGKIVVCSRGPGRVLKSFNVLQGGAVGMILVNETPSNVSPDSHWVPTIHLDDGADLLTFLAANPAATATWAAGAPQPSSLADDVAPFSSRGPGGLALKPDVGAPGQQVLAGTTPTPETALGLPGELYKVLDGTSMAAPHVAGTALLVRAAHPDWTPGQVRSAITGSATPDVSEGGAPATPFDTGSGRVRANTAVAPGLVLDETATRFASLGNDADQAVHLNVASVNAPAMPGLLRTTRTVTNPGAAATYTVGTTVGAGSSITVEPSTFTLGTGDSRQLEITIRSTAAVDAQQLGAITITAPSRASTRLPVAFVVQPGEAELTTTGCSPASLPAGDATTCTYQLVNDGIGAATVDLRAEGGGIAGVTGADLGATVAGGVATADGVALEGYTPGVPHTAPGTSPAGYLPLDLFGIAPSPIGDEDYINFTVPAFGFAGETFTRLGIDVNGYLVAGGAETGDNNCCDLTHIGDPARPNGVIAPFWTDLDGTGAPGVYAATLTDGTSTWIVVEWRVNLYGTSDLQRFQAWIGVAANAGAAEDVSFAYDPADLPTDGGQPSLVGAENRQGAGTSTLAPGVTPTQDLRVTTSAPVDGAPLVWSVTAMGTASGAGSVTVEATTDAHPGTYEVTAGFTATDTAPTITDHPDDLSVDALDTATFSAAATGGSLVRWEVQAPGSATWTTIPDETTSPLSFTAHRAADGNRYRAVFASAFGTEATSDAATLTVAKAASDTTLQIEPTGWIIGDTANATIVVSPAPAGGTVQLLVDGVAHGAPVGVDSATGQADVELTDLTVGSFDVAATFSGDEDVLASTSDVVRVDVDPYPVQIDLAVSPDQPARGQDVTFTATLSPAPSGGTVQFDLDGEPLGRAPVPLSGDSASVVATDVAAGHHTISATYSGDATHDGGTTSTAFTVVRNPSTTTIVEITSGIVGSGEPVEAHVTVVPAPNGGTVQMSVDGTPVGGPVTLDVDGEAVVDLGPLAAGTRTVGAAFSGDEDLDPSSDEATLTVYPVEEAFVRRAYQVVLGRNGDATGVAYWVGRIEDGLPRVEVSDRLASSPEGRERLVGGLFERVLDRQARAEDRAYWSGRLAAGMTSEDLLATLLASSEGYARPGGSPEDWVEKLYDVHLVRTPGQAEIAFWAGRLGANTPTSRRAVALGFGRATEVTQVALVQTAIRVCGSGALTSEQHTALAARWIASGRNHLRLGGHVLALVCPSGDGSAP